MENLSAEHIELYGKHLIEASAGTGKTHNITRIFLRLLLERALPVEQILVMTFTKDATEEIRGRIDDFLRESLHNWQTLAESDPYFRQLDERLTTKGMNRTEIKARLTQALLYIDEAAIFTIHGFCKRVLNQHAFTSGVSFNAQMEANTQDIIIEACQDWYRLLAQSCSTKLHDIDTNNIDTNHTATHHSFEKQDNASETDGSFHLVTEFWPDPISFLNQFANAINNDIQLGVQTPEQIFVAFSHQVEQAITNLVDNKPLLTSALIDVKKGQEKLKREQELAQLLQWLSDVNKSVENNISTEQQGENTNQTVTFEKMPDAFIDGRRFSRSPYKVELTNVFSAVNIVKKQVDSLQKRINKANALLIVKAGIIQIRAQVAVKKQQQNVLNFDDLITTLYQCLVNSSNSTLATNLYQQYPVALIDEFQDTDPKQFSILKAIYYQQADSALYLIGDPKQAIYGFRGGDVFAYLSARNDCDKQWLMDTNWRSSDAMITGYNRLFYGNSLSQNAADVFGDNIPYLPVKASPIAHKKVFGGVNNIVENQSDKQYKALQFIHFNEPESQTSNESVKAKKSQKNKSVSQAFRHTIATWCANEIATLLNDQSLHITSGDIALLVRDGGEALDIKQALNSRGLASVFMSNRANLLQSEQTQHLLQVLKGILFLENDRLYRAALTSPIMGYNHQQFINIQQNDWQWQQLKMDFVQLRHQWQSQGFITMALRLMHQFFVIKNNENRYTTPNLSEQADIVSTPTHLPQETDRILTNLLHLFELLQKASQRHHQPQALLFWFEQQCQAVNPDIEAELRLESDSNLIRIITQHGSKGMEYPVVFIPFATRHKNPLKVGPRQVSVIEYHDEQGKLHYSLDGSKQAKDAMTKEAYAESVRLLYVAVTRAEKRCYIMTTAFDQYDKSPLGNTLKWQAGADMARSIQTLASDEPDSIGLEIINLDDDVNLLPTTANSTEHINTASNVNSLQAKTEEERPQVAKFTGNIERDWWLSSFSALSRNVRHQGISTPDRDNQKSTTTLIAQSPTSQQQSFEEITDDSRLTLNPEFNRQYSLQEGTALRFTIAKGANTGNLLHDILQYVDFTAPDWQKVCQEPFAKYGVLLKNIDHEQMEADNKTGGENNIEANSHQLILWLEEILKTPLKTCFLDTSCFLNTDHENENVLSLSTINMADTLRETEFYYPMQAKHSHHLMQLLAEHRSEMYTTSDELTEKENKPAPKQDSKIVQMRVQLPSYHQLKGMMHGFIDLIFQANGKFYICDYKSNYLGDGYDDYNQAAMRDNIEKNHYDLQYLIYALALHRHLQYALAEYDIEKHFGGVFYLYLRGMSPLFEHNHGVYYRKISATELMKLDAIFKGEYMDE